MNSGDAPSGDRLTPSHEGRIDAACDRYEADWRAGGSPRIETYLDSESQPGRSALFRQLLALELELRARRGDRPDLPDYLPRFPAYRLLIEEAFRDPPGGIDMAATTSLGPVADGATAGGTLPKGGEQFERLNPGHRGTGLDGVRHELPETLIPPKLEVGAGQFGRYRLVRLIGEGAFGRVHLAIDEELQRQVAIKVPRPERFREPGDADVYLAEARTVATLDHPHIVPVYDVGRTADGSVYVVSKFIEGSTLAEQIEKRPTADEASRLVATMARALDHAHRRRLVHRDVKPANILIENATGTPYISDFGLAIREEDSPAEGTIAGTPAYMSPEQVRGEGHRLDGRSDVFSLGVVLYELLTGKRPFRGSTMMEMFHQVITADPPPPRALDDSVPAELERICLKALSKRASDRYATAGDMADDLRHWRSGPRLGPERVAIVPRGLRSFGPDDADFFLDLLPGSRGRDGLPESIRFWKTRIEETDPDKTFDVGLIFGPSGCGKSSLVKAGLLPHLSKSVVAVYVEATAEDTETRILRGLRKGLPDLPEGLGLVEAFALLRRGHVSPPGGSKVVILLDQFEQWLHARGAEPESDLAHALRQCDGGRLQAVVMVRDDFSMAASRLMRELETPIVEGRNFATVDLFDRGHAIKVLTKFGRAFGRLPPQPGNLSAAQRAFLEAAAAGLAEDGKVVSVRLSLFAEMVKDKPWAPATLEEVGGTEGVGVNFLEETFGSRKANPEHRHHQQAARQVLKALLPEVGTDIKGHMRSHAELLSASGYDGRSAAFHDLMRILDGELRLITPTDPDGVRSDSGSDPGSKYYQLTHDYLVPSLREWLTRKQKETRQGRAELRLAELSALWNARPENRRLPSWGDYRKIRRFASRKGWTAPQRRMMHRAALYHAQGAVRRLLDADLADVPTIIAQIGQLRGHGIPLLRKEQESAADQTKAKLHTALALLALDGSLLDYLHDQLLRSAAPDFPILRDALAGHAGTLAARLWRDASEAEEEGRRLRAAAALAAYEPRHPTWGDIKGDTALSLTRVKPEFLGIWKDAFRPVRHELVGPLSSLFRDRELDELQRALATSILADYSAQEVGLLTDLIEDADPKQFVELFPALARHGEAAAHALEAGLDRVAGPGWADPPRNPSWLEVPDDVRRSIESAAGLVEDRFLFCQALPHARLGDLVERLRDCGYRPRCVRPYRVGPSRLAAAIWARDDRPWRWLVGTDPGEILRADSGLRATGLVPIDVAIDTAAEGPLPCYTVVWEQAVDEDSEVRLFAGPLGDPEQRTLTGLAEENFDCIRCQVALDERGRPHGASVWVRRKNQARSTTRLFHGRAEQFREDDCPGLLSSDVRLAWGEVEEDGRRLPELLTTSLWSVSTRFESKVLRAKSVIEQQALGPGLAGEGYRPASISAAAGPGDGRPVAAVVWHRPLVAEEAKDRLAKRQANAAVALLKLGREGRVWPMLGHRPDPRTRSYLLHRLGPLDADPDQVSRQLSRPTEVSIQRALIHALGEFGEHRLAGDRRESWLPRLLDLYENHPDPGLHASVAWTLRQWGKHDEIAAVDRGLASGRARGGRGWYVNRQGQTFVIVPAPGEVVIGSPPSEDGREDGPEGLMELQRHVGIHHEFAIMRHLVTVAEFLRFRGGFFYRKYFSPEPDCPINNVSWYDAVAYCNWLNELEGIDRDQWCYLPNDRGEYAEGMTIAPDFIHLSGYRLPTEEEWEFACRAGAITSRYYGQSQDLDNHYACTVQNSLGRRTTRVGSFKANDLGLFDMLGNNLEWSHSRFHDPYGEAGGGPGASPEAPRVVLDRQMRRLRGATLVHPPETIRSAFIDAYPPAASVYGTSLRLGRTWRPELEPGGPVTVRNDGRYVQRGAACVSRSEFVRNSYRLGQKVNFPLFAWGMRPARTMG